jgi:hypothetical protein
MSAPHQSGCSEIAQSGNILPTLDVETPVTKGKGRRATPKAKTAPTSATADLHNAPATDKDEPPTMPRKRGRPKGSKKGPSTQAVETIKKQKVSSQPTQGNVRTQAKKEIPPRSLLPQCTNRNTHPAKPVMPRSKRTSAQVAEAKAKNAELLQRLDELEKQKKIMLAQMEVDEEEEDIEEEETAVRHLKDLHETECAEEITTFTNDGGQPGQETFPKDGDDPLWFPDSDVDEKGAESEGSKCESVQSERKPVSVWVLNDHSVITNQEHKEKEKGRERRNKGSYRN